MATGFTKGGTDLDALLAPLGFFSPAPATGFRVGGADLNTLYAPLSAGSAPSPTGFTVGGADLNAVFAAIGTTDYPISTFNGSSAYCSHTGAGSGSASVTFAPTGAVTPAVTSNNAGGAGVNDQGDYYHPVGGTPGASLWVRATANSSSVTGSGSLTGATGTLQQLSANRTWTASTTNANGTADWVLSFSVYSDAGGTALVATGVVTLSCRTDEIIP